MVRLSPKSGGNGVGVVSPRYRHSARAGKNRLNSLNLPLYFIADLVEESVELCRAGVLLLSPLGWRIHGAVADLDQPE